MELIYYGKQLKISKFCGVFMKDTVHNTVFASVPQLEDIKIIFVRLTMEKVQLMEEVVI